VARRTGEAVRPAPAASLTRRAASLLYEALLLVAVLWGAGLLYMALLQHFGVSLPRLAFQLYLATVSGAYFAVQWVRGGQTLAMKAWRLRLVRRDGGALRPLQALLRYVLALAGLTLLGSGFLWALLDRKGDFLHDRLAGTCIIHTGT
jgi:uncharacterized RDD family membrane protein YckC